MTNRDRILSMLVANWLPLDDDELSRQTGIQPRQTINMIRNRLAAEGLITREPGPNRKIVNSLNPMPSEPVTTTTARNSSASVNAGSSHEQLAAESVMLATLSQTLGVNLGPRRIEHVSGARVEIDGADRDLTVLVECWAHQGPAKVAQKYKLMNDAVKLHWIAQDMTPTPDRLILCVSDEAAIRHLRGRSWQGHAVTDLGVELHVVELPIELVNSIAEAQKRQYR